MATPSTGFLDEGINISDTGLGEQSALVTQKDLDPAYKVTKVQETVPEAPPISVRGGVDQFASRDLSNIISPFTDPTAIEERRKREKEVRETIARGGGAGELFVSEPDIDLDDPKVVDFDVDTSLPRTSIDMSTGTSPEISDRRVLKQQAEDFEDYSVKDPFKFTNEDYKRFAEETAFNVASSTVGASEIVGGAFKAGKYAYNKLGFGTDVYTNSAFIRNPQSYYNTMTGGGMGVPEAIIKIDPVTGKQFVDYTGKLATDATTGVTTYAPTSAVANQTTKSTLARDSAIITKEGLRTAARYAGTAIAAYSAFEAFKEKDYIQAGLNTGIAYATFTGNVGLALALTAASVAQSFFRFGRGKPKPGMGGSEIKYDQKTGQLAHSMTWSYNGFNPSQAKQHTDQAVKFVNNYMKEFGVSLDPKKFPQGQSNWQFLSRIDVSPYKNGSQSGAEMIERWLSSGAFVGNPSIYDPDSGERKYFNSQEEYEIAMQRFANRQFS
jgi:hypothetical protein